MPSECRVLLVEDHESSREALVALLSRFGFSICGVDTLRKAHAALDGQSAVILDINLPDGSGAEFLRRIRDEARPIRVAVTSALHNAREIAPGADIYVDKPITPEKLALLVQWLKTEG